MFGRILDYFKQKHSKIHSLILILLAFYLSTKYWNFVNITYKTIIKSLKEISFHSVSLIFIITVFIGIRFLFKYSDNKTKEQNEKYDKPRDFESEKRKHIQVILTETKRDVIKDYKKTLEIVIKNISEQDIDYIKGFVSIYKDKKRIYKIDFETKCLCKYFSERILYDVIDIELRNWNYFDIFIEKVKTIDDINENFIIDGKRIIRTYSQILNYSKFYDYKLFGFRTKYNLVWLKQKFKREVFPSIKFFYAKRSYHFYKRPFYLDLKDFLFRAFQFALVLLIVITISFLLLLTIVEIIKMISLLYYIWKDYFQQIVKIV